MKRRESVKWIGLLGLSFFAPIKIAGAVLYNGCKICKEAWIGLSKFNASRYQFRYIEPTLNLPKVFLYGDSISIGYTEYVRASLENKADVMRLHVNGNSSHNLVNNMEVFKKALFQPYLKDGWNFEWDVIHFNVGLHDLKYLADNKLNKEAGIQVSSLEVYESNLNNIISYLKNTYPKAKLIFATTTPVPDGAEGRFAGDAKKYNKVALKVLKNHSDIIINDLYTFSIPLQKTYAEGPGNVHYQSEGSRQQGIQTAKIISEILEIEPVACPSVENINAKFKAYESQ
ncbi:SGNH/GDSL hydrolase family protein [Cellulophaga sp. L1A9]|uniref:SGNH/GDSL hydrolase family protein n=1 Tax=Cellulophaga sp. L1A9 TaxID=2686362 RepID=UPI00131D686E|nr:SGNH/GDSL hydrolase family protein [Cellulophaga sp. L1A9]